MNIKILSIAILLIFVFFGGLYFIVAPIAQEELNGPTVTEVASTTETVIEVEKVPEKTSVTKEIPNVSSPVSAPATPSVNTNTVPNPVSVMVSGYTMAEVEAHATERSCWSVIAGEVYDLTSYISKHPGGSRNILKICGKDGTSLFDGQHGGESKSERVLENYKLGKFLP